MKTWKVATAVALALLLVGPRVAAADEEPPPDLPAVRKALQDMQRRLDEMQRRHEEETRALRDEIEDLRAASGRDEAGIDAELEKLLRRAEEESATGEELPPGLDTTFVARGLGLQALNPEISIAGDFLATWTEREDLREQSDFRFRVLDIHVESYLDPYSKLKAAIGVEEDHVHLGEAYLTRFGVLPGLSLTAGKFRQDFGVVNRWHKHALDQIDFPLALRKIFGPGGLNQVGLSLEQTIPEWLGGVQTIVLQVTDGENDRLFGDNSRNLPAVLLRAKNFRDLTKDTSLELGLTGLLGWNDEWSVTRGGETRTVHDRRSTFALGADLTVMWEPTDDMRNANLEWRSELYALSRGILAPDGTGGDRIVAWGATSSLQRRIARTLDVGVRLDWYEPDSKDYAADSSLGPHAVAGSNPHRWQVGPYLTWWQSPFVKVRLEVDWADGHHTGPGEVFFGLQIVFAAGPHKHERY